MKSEANTQQGKTCEKENCQESAELYKAPYSPDELNKWRYFCLKHVKEYNKAWNYYENKSPEEVEHDILQSITGSYKARPFGNYIKKATQNTNNDRVPDGYVLPANASEIRAFKILNLPAPCPADQIKKSYKRIALQLHPDRNMHKSSEERKKSENLLKSVNKAYMLLKVKLR